MINDTHFQRCFGNMIPTSSTHRHEAAISHGMAHLIQGTMWATRRPSHGCLPKVELSCFISWKSKFEGVTTPVRFKIPALKMQDAAQGFRATEVGTAGTTTSFPSASDCRCTLPRDGVGTRRLPPTMVRVSALPGMLALASTWDEDMVRLVASALGTEYKACHMPTDLT